MRLTCLLALCTTAIPLPPATAALLPDSGSVLASQTTSFDHEARVAHDADRRSKPPALRGSVESRVVRAGDGSLDFYWRVSLAEGVLSNSALSDFYGTWWDPAWRADSGRGVAPSFRRHSPAEQAELSFVDVVPGVGEFGGRKISNRSYLFFLDTNADAFDRSGDYLLDSSLARLGGSPIGGGSGLYGAFATAAVTTTPIPEPQTTALMLAGLAAIGLIVRRQRRR
jgi:hypothetical protein